MAGSAGAESAGETRLPGFTHSIAFRRAAIQVGAAVALLLLGWFLLKNLAANLSSEGVAIDFAFLFQESGFDVNESRLLYSASSS